MDRDLVLEQREPNELGEVVVGDVVRREQRAQRVLADLGLEPIDRLLDLVVGHGDVVLRRVVLHQPELDQRAERVAVARRLRGVTGAVLLSARRVLQAEDALEDPRGDGQLCVGHLGPGNVGGRGLPRGPSARGRERR